jgi:hypothetical protein
MTVAETIRSLKPGDKVIVTVEDRVLWVESEMTKKIRFETEQNGMFYNNDTIISIEVIDRPLAVGDRVIRDKFEPFDGWRPGHIVAIGKEFAIVQWALSEAPARIADLKRA